MIHTALHSIKSRNIDSRRNIVFTICQIASGHTYNVFPDEANMSGTIRSYDKESLAKMKERIISIAESVAEGFMCTATVEIEDTYPATVNHKEPTDHVIRLFLLLRKEARMLLCSRNNAVRQTVDDPSYLDI
jgi:metal-dependent amidase/aminoacylase/carboxypeptidase family protein